MSDLESASRNRSGSRFTADLPVRLATGLRVALVLAMASPATALDTVTRKSTDKRVAGKITSVTKSEIKVEPSVGAPTTVPANDVLMIDWDGQPALLVLARSKANAGQYAAALEDYSAAREAASTASDLLRAEIEYGAATTVARMSLADAQERQAAIERLRAFLAANPDHYRYYDGQMLLGEVLLLSGDSIGAETAFQTVAQAPWPDYQMAAKVAIGRVQFSRGDTASARSAFDEVASQAASTAGELSQKLQAMLGQAMCLQDLSQFDKAVETLGEVIHQCAPEDTRLQAEAYLRQGNCYVAAGQKTKEAIMAYLHLDVIPALAREKDLHAEALYHLSQLWPVVGQPVRAADAESKLESLYPNSEWTRKLAGG